MVTATAQRVRRERQQPTFSVAKWLGDLKLLGSLYVAYFIVWRELRRERKKERERKLEEVSRCRIFSTSD